MGETGSRKTKVAFIGISNWALDPAKMNRGVFLSRTPPDKQDLIKIENRRKEKWTIHRTSKS